MKLDYKSLVTAGLVGLVIGVVLGEFQIDSPPPVTVPLIVPSVRPTALNVSGPVQSRLVIDCQYSLTNCNTIAAPADQAHRLNNFQGDYDFGSISTAGYPAVISAGYDEHRIVNTLHVNPDGSVICSK